NGAGQGNPRAVASRQVNAPLAHKGCVALREALDEGVRVGRLGSGDDLLLGGNLSRVGDVFGDAAGKQHGFLLDDCELVAQIVQPVFAQVDVVEKDASQSRVVESKKEAHERRFACAGRSGTA